MTRSRSIFEVKSGVEEISKWGDGAVPTKTKA